MCLCCRLMAYLVEKKVKITEIKMPYLYKSA